MGKVAAIALNTFREAVRNKVLYFLLIFAIFMMGFSMVISTLSISAPEKLIKNMGLFSIDFIGFLIAMFVGVYMVYNELDKRTIYTIVSKPIGRSEFVLGKFFGLLLTIYVNVIIMAAFFFAVLYYRQATEPEAITKALYFQNESGEWTTRMSLGWYYFTTVFKSLGLGIISLLGYTTELTQGLLQAIAMSMLGLAIMTAFAILYSTFTTPTLSAVFTFLTWIIANLNEDIVRYAWRLQENYRGQEMVFADKFKYWFAMVWAHILPNLGFFDLRTQVIYGVGLEAARMTEAPEIQWLHVLYGIVYTAGVVTLACFIFRRRSFK
jgi:ABC-type transport system involved in multi-copper enzyme maturation permease subunit